jgi:ATP-dependent DNA helicase RecG
LNSLISTSVASLKGIGPNRQQALVRLGIESIWDLLLHLPFRYEDRSTVTPIGSLHAQQQTVVQGSIDSCSTTRGRKPRFDCHISDPSASIVLRFFNHYPGQQQRFASGQQIRCYGTVRFGQDGLEFVHPECQIIPANKEFDALPAHLSPVYPLSQGLTQLLLRQSVEEALATLRQCDDQQPDWLTLLPDAYQTLTVHQALSQLHFPEVDSAHQLLGSELNNFSAHPARKRLALEELLAHYHQATQINDVAKSSSLCRVDRQAAQLIIDDFLPLLPFQPTKAQTIASKTILDDLASDNAMCRLIQGDVGSGKTLVAACAALPILQTGAQVVLLAPTELLAEQHLSTFQTWFAGIQQVTIKVVLVKGGQSNAVRQELLDDIQAGTANMIIGTHAVLQESVQFQKLGLFVIDEQHRFGVDQRASLMRNNTTAGQRPHQLIMTATPIPRTLALLQYAGVDVTQLKEMPAGRLPVTTIAMSTERRQQIIQRISDWVGQGKQAYWVCTVIEDSDQTNREALQVIHNQLCTELTEVRIGLLHGKMPAQDKQTIMDQFRNHQFDVLVATTVIEVGVDVVNANLMVIEDAHMLGLAQLHQLRGRVGRGTENGYCVLFYQPPLSDIARQRLGLLRECDDGFEIAEKDLQLRGPGELTGLRQSGAVCFRVADLAHDQDLLELIQALASQMADQNSQMMTELQKRWSSHSDNPQI